jgi:hypothetical protein
LNAPFGLISAAHGLVAPDHLLEPYDLKISGVANDDRELWRKRLISDIAATYDKTAHRFVVLGSGLYASEVASVLSSIGAKYELPLAGLPAHMQASWLSKALSTARRFHDLRLIYSELNRLTTSGAIMPLSDLLSRFTLPARGVYIFLDPDETSQFTKTHRIVRVGTHAVSIGSKATLRTRLRTHKGTASGAGNHRSSIFRLHVGAAFLARDSSRQLPSWGSGDSAAAPATAAELDLESEVSQYISRLNVAIIPVDDSPSKGSMRRVIEKNLIALLTEDGIIIDKPSKDWLGNWSSRSAIRESGLWNVNDVFTRYDPKLTSLLRWSE